MYRGGFSNGGSRVAKVHLLDALEALTRSAFDPRVLDHDQASCRR